MKRVIFIKNTLILTATALVLRFAGMLFKIWLSTKVGSEAIGLYQIIMSVYICISSFASSGLSTAVTRLVTDELDNSLGIKKILSCGVWLTLVVAFISFTIMFFGAEVISVHILNDTRAVFPVKILSLGLIFIGLCSLLRGYFIARRKAYGSSVSQITEQLVRIGVTAAIILKSGNLTVTSACVAIVIGDTAAEIVASLLLFVMYKFDVKYISAKNAEVKDITKRLLKISVPITSGRYLSTLLRTVESAAVPRLLTLSGMTASAALSGFGIIKGMALPIILFPSATLSVISLLLIPEISEAKTKKADFVLKSTIFISLKITTLISVIIGFVFWFCGEKLGILLYKDASVGFYMKMLAPLTPLMYIDSIADGMLKGLDKQGAAFRYSVADSAIRLLLVFLILPKASLTGFIIVMYISNIFTAFLHFRLLVITSKIKIKVADFFSLPLLCGIFSCYTVNIALEFFNLPNLIFILLFCILSLFGYFFLLRLLGVVSRNEF